LEDTKLFLISLCMIVKNEEVNLAECLQAIANYMDEIVIVDTGSTDRTKEIALQYTSKVYDYQWNNDFAVARNFSISKASNEFILVIDSDETIENINIDEIRRLIESNPSKIGRLLRINEFTRKGTPYKFRERVNRLFSKNYYQYSGTIHEQLIRVGEIENDSANDTYLIPLTIRHSGYEGELDTRKRKTERNINLLKKALVLNPDDPYLLYQLGKSYYMEEDYISACDFLGQALCFDLDPKLEYVQDMVESYGYSLINSGQYDAAMQLLNVYDEFAISADFVFLAALILMNGQRFTEAIREFNKAAQFAECKVEGVNSYMPYYNIGVILECMGDIPQAKIYYNLCKDYYPARERVKIIADMDFN